MFSATISKQLNAAFYLHDIDKPCPLVWEETMSSVCYACCNSQFSLVHLSIAPRPLTGVFGMRTRLNYAHAYILIASFATDSSRAVL